MSSTRKRIVMSAVCLLLFLFVSTLNAYAGGKSGGGSSSGTSELVVRRVDSNQLIRLRIYVDGKSKSSLNPGQTISFKIKNGYHTIRVGFDDYQRGTEIAQFTANNTTHVFSVTDTSIVLISEDAYGNARVAPPPGSTQSSDTDLLATSNIIAVNSKANSTDSSIVIDNSVRSAFDRVTKAIKNGRKIAIINVDGDNVHEANFILEELTHLSVNSPKKYYVIDRRVFDAYRTRNSIGLPSYENDFMLRYLGSLVRADYVISARIDGPGDLRRLRVKALDVTNGALVGDASERL